MVTIIYLFLLHTYYLLILILIVVIIYYWGAGWPLLRTRGARERTSRFTEDGDSPGEGQAWEKG